MFSARDFLLFRILRTYVYLPKLMLRGYAKRPILAIRQQSFVALEYKVSIHSLAMFHIASQSQWHTAVELLGPLTIYDQRSYISLNRRDHGYSTMLNSDL